MEWDINGEGQNFSEGGFVKILAGRGGIPPVPSSLGETLIMIYNETTKEVYIDKQKRIKPNSSSNHNTDKLDIH